MGVFKAAEEAFDADALPVGGEIVCVRVLERSIWRDHQLAARVLQPFTQGLGIISSVGKQIARATQVVSIAGRENQDTR